MEIIILLISLALIYSVVKKPLTGNAESFSVLNNLGNSVKSSDLESNIVPEDSVLKRHYLSHLYYQKLVITNPYPSDVVLRRHYDTQVASLLPSPAKTEVKAPKKVIRKPRTTTKPVGESKKSPKSSKSSPASAASKTKKK